MRRAIQARVLELTIREAEELAAGGHPDEGYQALLAGLRHSVPANDPDAEIGLRFFEALDRYARRHGLARTRIVSRFAHAVAHVVESGTLAGADLTEQYLGPVILTGQDLCSARMAGVNLYNSDLRGAGLRDADLHGADLSGADLSGVDLRSANLRRADFRGADLSAADATGANLEGANLIQADLGGAHLKGARIQDALYDQRTGWPAGCDPAGSGAVQVGPGADLSRRYFARLGLYELDLTHVNLEAANLRDAHLEQSNLGGATLRDANLTGASLDGCNLAGADLTGAALLDAAYTDATRWPEGFHPRAAGAVRFRPDGLGMVPAD
jgi:uncharacterized protein YjbI with pentapeptide repeats